MFSINRGKKWSLLTGMALAVIALTLSISPVLAGGATVFQVDISFLGPPPDHPCTGGELDASGMITVVTHPTGQGYFLHIGMGKGGSTMVDVDTGDLYYFRGSLNEHTVDSGGGTTVHHFNYTSPGPGVNFVGQILEHVTITPDGDIAVFFDWGRFTCK